MVGLVYLRKLSNEPFFICEFNLCQPLYYKCQLFLKVPIFIPKLISVLQYNQITIQSCAYIMCMLYYIIFVDIGSDVAALAGVGVVVLVLGLTEQLVAVLVFLFCVYKKKQGEDLLC